MRKFSLFSVILISILVFFKTATAQVIPFSSYWVLPLLSPPLRLALGYGAPILYPPLLPFQIVPAVAPSIQLPLPLMLRPQISIPSPVQRLAAATITIFSVPTLSAIQVTSTIPATTTSLNATSTSTTSYTFILPSLLTIPTSPYTQTQTAAITAVFPVSPLIGTTTAIAPGLAAGLAPAV
ncbi:MAG: hypothetical protein K6U11_05285 [bacterium]|nr:hypothetical protein [bacterium]